MRDKLPLLHQIVHSQVFAWTFTGVLLIAGGIGVTPVRVMFAECLHRGYPVTVLYTFRGEKDAAFLNEFKQVSHLKYTCPGGIA